MDRESGTPRGRRARQGAASFRKR